MARKKEKNWKGIYLSIDKEISEKLEELAKFENLSKTELVEFLISNWDMGINPSEKLKELNKEKEVLENKLIEINRKVNETIQHLTLFNDWKNKKVSRKREAINILRRRILDNHLDEAERLSKVWQRITGISAIELLLEARDSIQGI